MARPEASLWDYLSNGILPAEGHYSRIESDTSVGFPDVHYTIFGYTGTIELKVARNKRWQPFFIGGLLKSQMDWIRDEIDAGGRVLIIAQVKKRCYLLYGEYWDTFNEFEIKDFEAHSAVKWTRGTDYPTREILAALKIE